MSSIWARTPLVPSAGARVVQPALGMTACSLVWGVIASRVRTTRSEAMQWTTPRIVEIALGAEINSYVCGETN